MSNTLSKKSKTRCSNICSNHSLNHRKTARHLTVIEGTTTDLPLATGTAKFHGPRRRHQKLGPADEELALSPGA